MNIAFFTDTYHPYVSGVANSIDLFKDELEKQGHQVFIFAPLLKDENGNVPVDGPRIYRVESLKQNLFSEFTLTLPNLPPIFHDFYKFKIDVVHSHTPFYMGMYASIVALFYNIPVVHTYHTLYEKYTGHSLFKNWYRVDKAVMNLAKDVSVFYSQRCDGLIAPSEKVKRMLQNYGVKNDIAVIQTGIDLEKFKNIEKNYLRKKFNISDNKKIIMYLGRVALPKNPMFFAEMFEKVAKENSDCVMAIIGSGPSLEDLKKEFEKKNLQDRVIFGGFANRDEVPKCFADASLFVFASKTDTQSLVLLEAAASSLPIVMLKDDGLTSVVSDLENGFEIPNDDKSLYAKKVVELLQNDELRVKMSIRSQELSKQFSIQNQAQKLLNLYLETIKFHEESSWRKRIKRGLNKEISLKDFFMEDGQFRILKKLRKLKDKIRS